MSIDTLMILGRLIGEGHILAAAKHNKRTMYADGATGIDIDASRTHLNYSLAGPDKPADVVKLWAKLRANVGIDKPKRHDEVSAIEIVFSLRSGTPIDLRKYFADCTTWAAKRFGGELHILASDVHLDQSQPHCHVLMLPLVDGKMRGSDLYWGESKKRTELHADFHTDVGSKYGLRQPPPKLSGTAKKAAARQVRECLKEAEDDAQSSRIWGAICNAIDRDPEPFMADLGITRTARPAKSFKEIALSTGAGPKTEAGQARKDARLNVGADQKLPNPIGFDHGPDDRTLSCVGFTQSNALLGLPSDQQEVRQSTPRRTHMESTKPPVTRHRDCDMDPATWDSMSGEHIPRRPAATLARKATAHAWVSSALRGELESV